MKDDYLNTEQTATHLRISRNQVQKLIIAGRLKAKKFGRDYMIFKKDLAEFAKLPRQVGYPKGRPRTGEKNHARD